MLVAALPGQGWAEFRPACPERLTLAGNEYRIQVPRVGSMDPKVYPVAPREYQRPDCPRRDPDLRPSPDTGYGTPGSPLVSPGQVIPGRLPLDNSGR